MAAHNTPNSTGPKGRGNNPKAQEKSYKPQGGGNPLKQKTGK